MSGKPDGACGRCGAPVLEADLESGASVLLFGKRFCPACKKAAIDDVSLEELSEPPPTPRKPAPPKAATPPPPPKPAPKPGVPPPTRSARPAGPPSTGRHRAPARPASKTPLLAGGAVAVVAIVAVAAFALGRSGSPPAPPAKTPPPAPPPAAPAAADPDAGAKSAWSSLEPLLRRSDVSFDEQLAAIERARPRCKGTPYEAKLDEAKARVLSEKDGVEAGKRIGAVLDTLKKIAQEDKDFARYAEFQDLAQSARDLAARSSPAQLADINRLQTDYAGRYEKAAQPFFDEIEPAASGLASEKRWDAALAKIETFPARFRRSGAWRGLERLKQQIERDRR